MKKKGVQQKNKPIMQRYIVRLRQGETRASKGQEKVRNSDIPNGGFRHRKIILRAEIPKAHMRGRYKFRYLGKAYGRNTQEEIYAANDAFRKEKVYSSADYDFAGVFAAV